MIKLRAHLKFCSKDDINLPIHHNHILQGFIYNSFADETFAKFLHEEGYKWKKRNFKLFTFSRLNGKLDMDKKNKRIIFKTPVTLTISSIKNRIIEDLVTNIIKSERLLLGRQEIFLEEVKMEDYTFQGETAYVINFLSPVTAYKTELVNDKKKTHYFKPWDNEFKQQLKANLKKKYEIVEGKKIEGVNFEIEPGFDKQKKDFTIILFRGFVIKGWTGHFLIKGNPELLKLGYDCGLGAKNSMGHGCFEVLEKLEGGEIDD